MGSKIKKRWLLPGVGAVLIAALVFWQWDNIQALRDYASYSQEELEEQMAQNDQAIKDMVSKLPDLTVRDMTEEEREALWNGTLTQEELADRLLNPAPEAELPSESTPEQAPDAPAAPPGDSKPVSAQPSEKVPEEKPQPAPEVQKPEAEKPAEEKPVEQKPVEQKPEEQKPAEEKPAEQPSVQDNYRNELSALVAKVYVLREEYLIALDQLQAQAIAEYKAIPKEERTGTKLANLVSRYLSKGTALEKECDRRMDAIVVALENLIRTHNGDRSVVDTVITTYASEKRLKKAWYISELEKKGLI